MARLSVADPKVRVLVEKLVALVIEVGSVNKACDLLNAALASKGIKGLIYPNRVHQLLSEDPTRALNEATVQSIHLAFESAQAQGVEPSSEGRLLDNVVVAWRASTRSASAIHEVSEMVGLPPAVVRRLLEKGKELDASTADTFGSLWREGSSSSKAKGVPPQPDWSFQDTAVQRCLNALKVGPNRKVGLILPTGAGKTRTALRIALLILARDPDSNRKVIWVTHLKTLYSQALRELKKMLRHESADLPADSIQLLAKRIDFMMVSHLAETLKDSEARPLLVIVDEAHHAAAASYAPIFETSYPLHGLFLTATPNRTDGLPIGIDDIAYTTTYKELAERGVILIPDFEDFDVPDFQWSEQTVRDLADKVISRAAEDYVKILVLAPTVSRVEEFHKALVDRLAAEPNHPLSEEDIGFVHGTGNSLQLVDNSGKGVRATTDEFIEHFMAKPAAITVSAQILLEGFDDPEINAVVITYPSQSMVRLMQAAGRCVRYTPTKQKAFVLQARKDSLAYHFDQRWLYQEISDYLRPQLLDIDYGYQGELEAKVQGLLRKHNVSPAIEQRIMASARTVPPGGRCRLLLSGLPYYGSVDDYPVKTEWSALLEDSDSTGAVREIFNLFSALEANLSDPSDFLRKHGARFGITPDVSEGSAWRIFTEMLTAMYFAGKELFGDGSTEPQGKGRPFVENGATTWLKYITFHYRPVVPAPLRDFLLDCYNRDEILNECQQDPERYSLVAKIPMPLDGCEAHAFSPQQEASFKSIIEGLRESLRSTDPGSQLATLASRMAVVSADGIPQSIVTRIERFLSDPMYHTLVFSLTDLKGKSLEATSLSANNVTKEASNG